MTSTLLDTRYHQIRERLMGLFTDLHALAVAAGPPQAAAVAAEAIASVHAPFLFVVVGEVKAGKSSLVNALLEAEVCAVAPQPCTDVIQKIIFADPPSQRVISTHQREIGLPAPILKDIAIVDTPGTNTIVERHQEITEAFIPQSDLALFVFPATNPHTRSAWDFFDFIHDAWRRRAVFILQQKDRATAEELDVNLAKVREYAQTHGVAEPAVFAVSARTGDGMDVLRQHIRDSVTGGRRARGKLESCLGTALTVLDQVEASLAQQHATLTQDRKEEAVILDYLTLAEGSCRADVDWIHKKIAEAYDRHAATLLTAFEDGLSLSSMARAAAASVMGDRDRMRLWLDGIVAAFQTGLDEDVRSASGEGAGRLAKTVARVLETLAGQLSEQAAATSRHSAVGVMSQQRVDGLDQARQRVAALLDEAALDERLAPKTLTQMGEHAVAGGMITAFGAVIVAATHAIVIDVTGGIITLFGAILAINILAFRRRASIAAFRQALQSGRERLLAEVEDHLAHQVASLFAELRLAFEPFFKEVGRRDAALADLAARAQAVRKALRAELDSLPEAP